LATTRQLRPAVDFSHAGLVTFCFHQMVDGAGECWRYAPFIGPPNTLLDHGTQSLFVFNERLTTFIGAAGHCEM
jgi:hypothetical protein